MESERRERLEVEVDPDNLVCRESEVSSSSAMANSDQKQMEEMEEHNNYSPSPRASPTPSTPGQTLLPSTDFNKASLAAFDFKAPGTPLDFSFSSPRKPMSPPTLSIPPIAPAENIYESAAKLLFMSVKWSRSIPSFQQLAASDQQLLLESGWSQLFLLSLAQWAVIFFLLHYFHCHCLVRQVPLDPSQLVREACGGGPELPHRVNQPTQPILS